MPDPNVLPFLTASEARTLLQAAADVQEAMPDPSEAATGSEHKPIFFADIDEPTDDCRYIEVNGWDGYTCGRLRVPSEHAAALRAWIEAYPSLNEAAKVEEPKS